jgi:hypothetical protein
MVIYSGGGLHDTLSAWGNTLNHTKRLGIVCIGICVLLACWAVISPSAQPTVHAQWRPADFAKSIESDLSQRGIRAHVTVKGSRQDVLLIEGQGINGPVVYELVTSPLLAEGTKPAGIKTVRFTDAGGLRDCRNIATVRCEQQWDYNVERESMIWLPSSL